jgi:hypothetical protein
MAEKQLSSSLYLITNHFLFWFTADDGLLHMQYTADLELED